MTLRFVTSSGETKTLHDLGRGIAMLWPDEVCVVVAEDGNNVTCWTQGEPRKVVAAGTAVCSPDKAGKADGKPVGGRRPRGPSQQRAEATTAGTLDSARWAMLNAFVDSSMGTLPRAAVCVWLCLYRDTKANGVASTGISDLASRSKCDRSTVIRSLRLLVESGRLEQVRRGGIGRGPSSYRVK